MAKTHSRDYLKRLGAVILLIKSWCLLQNVIYPPPELEAFNVDHKLGRTSGSKDTSAKQQNKSQLFVLAPTRALTSFSFFQLNGSKNDARKYFYKLTLIKLNRVPEVLCTETIYDHQTESFRIYDLQNVSYLQRPKVINCSIMLKSAEI